jgi:hypothetical protein
MIARSPLKKAAAYVVREGVAMSDKYAVITAHRKASIAARRHRA